MPKGIYPRTEKQLQTLRENAKKNGLKYGFKKGAKRPFSEKHKEALSTAQTERFKNIEERKKISKKLSGKATWNKGLKGYRKGYKMGDEQKEKIRQSHLNRDFIRKSPINERIRRSKPNIEWRREIFIRDNYTCQECGIRSKKELRIELNAHHIKPFALFPQLRLAIENGTTLCSKCHKEQHTGYKAEKIG